MNNQFRSAENPQEVDQPESGTTQPLQLMRTEGKLIASGDPQMVERFAKVSRVDPDQASVYVADPQVSQQTKSNLKKNAQSEEIKPAAKVEPEAKRFPGPRPQKRPRGSSDATEVVVDPQETK